AFVCSSVNKNALKMLFTIPN
ncbi:glyoxalase-like domain protein, partial [Vibrio parahaemolyticus EKP-008]